MYKVVYWRYGKRQVDEYDTIDEAHRNFNFIGEYEIGFSECVLNENDLIVRDGMQGIYGVKKEKRIGTKYLFN